MIDNDTARLAARDAGLVPLVVALIDDTCVRRSHRPHVVLCICVCSGGDVSRTAVGVSLNLMSENADLVKAFAARGVAAKLATQVIQSQVRQRRATVGPDDVCVCARTHLPRMALRATLRCEPGMR